MENEQKQEHETEEELNKNLQSQQSQNIPFLKLIFIAPIGFKNEQLFQKPEKDRINILYVEIISNKKIGNTLVFYAKGIFNRFTISGIYFNAIDRKTRHLQVGNQVYLKGKVFLNEQGYLQIINPFKIAEPNNKIEPVYKKDNYRIAIEKFLNYENLKKYNLPYAVMNSIMKLHLYPNDEVVSYFEQFREFQPDILYALKFIEAFYYINNMKNKILDYPPLKKLDGNYQDWIETLPIKLTGDQLKAINDIAIDVKKDIAMRRIVVGDVGSGKTMVILASMVISYPNKSILMAPTSILAEQLYNEAIKFLPNNYKIVLLTQKTTKKTDLTNFDVLIGTSAILHRDLPEVPLLIVDEQHRFGTRERLILENIVSRDNLRPHFIQLSATPIPRTQALINGTFIKQSLIEEMPFKKNIKTIIIRSKNFEELINKIKIEINKNNQVIIVYPLVEKSDHIKYQSLEESESWWKNNFQDVYVTHGGDKNKNQVLVDFREKGKILLSTTVIEVGISLPRLTIIVIVGAERLGLATLHQLRGRVSRTGLESFCYLYTKSTDPKAFIRLQDFSSTLNGFDIASMDLANRKGGDIIQGIKQSGETFEWLNLAYDKNIVQDVINHYKF